ncbi:DUF1616 domain-containing protein [Natronorubrum tibetense]|uniref:DUF1616 domain-containing protein n=1 Tax=Natronorubrum tibetense GA33 TaxID=1114856 RepID=L9VKF2_9EURY|nr:DUF1616 domain-containing protein [Natronorubrum tibetense]ELY37690.1 hypothetical protein C496_19320 [Natronorubrum tibetense GA33]
MDASRTLVAMLPRPVRRLPADLAAILILVALTNIAVFAPVVRETPLRIPLGLVFVIFVPGYAVIAALFPEDGSSSVTARESTDSSLDAEPPAAENGGFSNRFSEGIDGIERAALAIGLSIAITPLLGLILNFTPWGIRLVPIMVAGSAVTIVAVAVAAVRRWELPPDERFHVPYREWYVTSREALLSTDSRADTALTVLLVASVVLAVGTVSYAVVVPPDHERFSAVYLLGEDDDGELVMDNYPEEFIQGEPQEIIVGVDNHEHRTVDYTVVVLEQSVVEAGNETVVEDQRELERFETQLDHDETWHHPHDVAPTMTGEDVRLVWLLYPDDVPDEPAMESAPYAAQLWIDVDEA